MIRRTTLIALGLALFFFSACVTVSIPVEEYNLARAAIDAARESDSPRYSPGLWYKAEQAYRDAERLFRERRYSEAKKLFVEAKYLGEKAENAAKLVRFQQGDEDP